MKTADGMRECDNCRNTAKLGQKLCGRCQENEDRVDNTINGVNAAKAEVFDTFCIGLGESMYRHQISQLTDAIERLIETKIEAMK